MARQVPSKVNDPASASNPLPANLDDQRNTAPESAAENESKPPYSEGAQEEMDHDLRHRMISEAAYQLYAQRGYVDGFELDDWLEAEAMVDRLRGTQPTN
jgi:hypothetical protein